MRTGYHSTSHSIFGILPEDMVYAAGLGSLFLLLILSLLQFLGLFS